MKSVAIVVPSIRDVTHLESLTGCDIIVVDDTDGKIKQKSENQSIYNYERQKEFFKEIAPKKWKLFYKMIPHKTDTCRSFGFLAAYKQEYDIIITLDDDCIPQDNFIEIYEDTLGKNLSVKAAETDRWYNTLDNLVLDSNTITYARGYPYEERYDKKLDFGKASGRVVCNMGYWLNIPDVNGTDKLYGLPKSIKLKEKLLTISKDINLPVSIMNVGFLREVVPAYYQVPMNVDMGNQYHMDRFGDIWSGYILKRIIDIKGDLLTVGEPVVEHIKEGNLNSEISKELYGHLISPIFYSTVDKAASKVDSSTYLDMYGQFASAFSEEVEKTKTNYIYNKYLKFLAKNMLLWSEFCNILES